MSKVGRKSICVAVFFIFVSCSAQEITVDRTRVAEKVTADEHPQSKSEGTAPPQEIPPQKRADELLKRMGAVEFKEREEATAALEKLIVEHPQLLDTLSERLEEIEDIEVKMRLEEVVTRYRRWRITPDLLEKFPNIIKRLESEDEYVRRRMAEELGESGLASAAGILVKLLKEDAEVRSVAAKALAKIGGKQAIESLVETLRHPEADVRRFAAITLGKIGDGAATQPLVEAMLNDGEEEVREYAASALGKIGDERAVEPLLRALKDKDEDVRWQATLALVKIGEPAVEPSIEALKDKDLNVRRGVAYVLGKLCDERAVEPLIGMLSSEC